MSPTRTMAYMLEAAGRDPLVSVPLVFAHAHAPNMSWLDFLSGDLTEADWALIARVEAGEITTAQAMSGRANHG